MSSYWGKYSHASSDPVGRGLTGSSSEPGEERRGSAETLHRSWEGVAPRLLCATWVASDNTPPRRGGERVSFGTASESAAGVHGERNRAVGFASTAVEDCIACVRLIRQLAVGNEVRRTRERPRPRVGALQRAPLRASEPNPPGPRNPIPTALSPIRVRWRPLTVNSSLPWKVPCSPQPPCAAR